MNDMTSPTNLHKLTREELQQLAAADRKPSVSIYMPTHAAGREIRQDPIRLKNLIKEAETQLEDLSEDGIDTTAILDFCKSLPESETDTFWHHSSDGMALFMQEGFARGYRLPVDFDELVVVANRFHIKPLFSYLQGDGHFYVLAVSPNKVRFFEGGKHRLTELHTDVLPKSLQDALNIDEYQSTLQFHSHTVGGASGATDDKAIYHGQGAGSDADKKEELLKFFRKLDDGITEFFGVESAPLVFAGVEYLFPIYQQANNYRSLVDQPVTGNKDDASADELHGPAWDIVQPRFAAHRDELLEKYGTLAAHSQGSDDIDSIIQAARQGRVETVLVAEGVRRWGAISNDGKITFAEENDAESQDLLDYAATHTLLNGGDVLLMDGQTMPSDSPIAAMYRY